MAVATTTVDVILGNKNKNLGAGGSGGSEPDVAVNPANPKQIAVTSFFQPWQPPSGHGIFVSTDAGASWTVRQIPPPPGLSGVAGCPCDQTVAFGRDGTFYGTFLLNDAGRTTVVTGSTKDVANPLAWKWRGNPAQLTNRNGTSQADQPWLMVNRDPTTPSRDDTYVAYDDFAGGPTARVSVSLGAKPPNFTRDNPAGTESPLVTNPGLRLAADPSTGFVYALYETSTGSGQPKTVTYRLNRSVDGGQTWSLNGNANGIVIDTVPSDQADYKFGSVNALLGGVDHAAVDPGTGDVYVVYGSDTAARGVGNQILVRRVTKNGSGGVTVGAASVVNNSPSAALPSVAVTNDGNVGVLFDTYDGAASDGFPLFSAHLSRSKDGGNSFSDDVVSTFESPTLDNRDPRQRVLGDYQYLQSQGRTFYGVFSGNRAAFGSNVSTIDPIFFSAPSNPPGTGTVLRRLSPAHVGNGRAVAFDPATRHLFYTNSADPNIYVVDTSNNPITTLSPGINYGSLSWDSIHHVLWGGRYDGSGGVDQINPTTGVAVHQFNFPLPHGDSCYGQAAGFIDGLAFDAQDRTLWLSDDNARTLFHVSLAGAALSKSAIPDRLCNTGIASAGGRLLLGLQSGPDQSPYFIGTVTKSNPSVLLSTFVFNQGNSSGPEGIAFDSKTFAPTCAVWTNQFGPTTLTAYSLARC